MKKGLVVLVIIIVALIFFIVNYNNNNNENLAEADKNISENQEKNVTDKEDAENTENEEKEEKKLESVEPIVIKVSDNVYCEILPEMELVSGVMTQTKWIQDMAAKNIKNIYFDKLQKFFSKYIHPFNIYIILKYNNAKNK